MGFLDFLTGAVLILVGFGVALIFGLGGIMALTQGQGTVGGIMLVIAFVAGVFGIYQQGRQPKRV